jgi:hypothetical protein
MSLTSGAAGDEHKKVDYAEVQADAVTAGITFSVKWADDAKKATITGRCPECRGMTSMEFPAGVPGVRFRGPDISTLPSPVTLLCECGHPHNDRPEGAPDRGCGRYWLYHVDAADRVPPGYLP